MQMGRLENPEKQSGEDEGQSGEEISREGRRLTLSSVGVDLDLSLGADVDTVSTVHLLCDGLDLLSDGLLDVVCEVKRKQGVSLGNGEEGKSEGTNRGSGSRSPPRKP